MNEEATYIHWETCQNEYKGEPECFYSPLRQIVWNSGSVVMPLTFWALTLTGLMGGTNSASPKIDFSFPEDFNSVGVSNYMEDDSREELERLRRRLKNETSELLSLKDNWDGEGACGTSWSSLITALSMLDLDVEETRIELISDIYTNRNGTISIQWDNDEGEMIGLEIGQRKMAYFVTKNECSNYQNDLEINNENLVKLFRDLATL